MKFPLVLIKVHLSRAKLSIKIRTLVKRYKKTLLVQCIVLKNQKELLKSHIVAIAKSCWY